MNVTRMRRLGSMPPEIQTELGVPLPAPDLAVAEEHRLAELRRSGLLEKGAEERFDELARLAAAICDTPFGLVSIVAEDRQFFKARVGFEPTQASLDESFCAHAIADTESPFVVQDASKDERFSAMEMVAGPPFIRFYAGVAVRTATGAALGTLCVVDTVPRSLDSAQLEALSVLARQVTAHIELDLERANARLNERMLIEQSALRAGRTETLGRLAGGIAHDLNNVLAPILITAAMVREELDDEDLRDDLDVIENSARRGARMIERLLTFARGREGTLEKFEVGVLVADVVRLISETFPKNITIETDVRPNLSIFADQTQLHQVLTNLAVNARDAMPDGGVLEIKARREMLSEEVARDLVHAEPGEFIVLEVIDSGQGIDRDDIDSIFDPYFTTKPLGKGTGLGLSMSLGIVRAHGGFIVADSKRDEGTVMSIYLPVETSVGLTDDTSSVAELAPDAAGRPRTILIIDDEPSILRAATRALERAGHVVHTAADGADGLAQFVRHESIDTVITDLMMPTMGGLPVVAALRKLSPSTLVVVWSGSIDRAALDQLDAEGAPVVLHKPFSQSELLEAIDRAEALRQFNDTSK